MKEQPTCCLCGQLCEPWPTGDEEPLGYGHNPAPLGTWDDDRCCNTCNDTEVIPARITNMQNRTN
jgi:hypothetical protein